MKRKLRSFKNRIYSDYLMSCRLAEYQKFLETALEQGYFITSIINYYDLVMSNNIKPRIVILRHDIDTDLNTAKLFFEIERSLGVKSSFYFRHTTISPKLMTEIEEYGSESSYHYEEVASYCKTHRIKDRKIVFKILPIIREQFICNFWVIKRKTGLSMRSVASHGDFVNRYLAITNNILITPDVKKKCNIAVEAYDPIIKEDCTNISDAMSPVFWSPFNPIKAFYKGEPKINILTHPRHWRTAFWVNTKDNLKRLIEGLEYRF